MILSILIEKNLMKIFINLDQKSKN